MADIKNFGLVGVGPTIQLGKAGPKFNANAGHIEVRSTEGNLTTVMGANAVGASDFVTLQQLVAVQQGASNA
ncbi:MAG: hypothetical protein EOP83_36860, partial [Verrucomicrobiaceae bacterium]